MKLAEQNEWKTNNHEESVFGTYNGYLFTAFEGKGFKTFITPLAGINEEGLEAILAFLKKNQRALNLRNYEVSDNFLCVRQHEGLFKLSPDKMEYLLAQISGLLSLYELPADACVVCGESTRKKGLYFGFYCHLHPECLEQEPVDFTGTTFSDNQIERMADNSQAASIADAEEDDQESVSPAVDAAEVPEVAADEPSAPAVESEPAAVDADPVAVDADPAAADAAAPRS
jgi:hypothetical protein